MKRVSYEEESVLLQSRSPHMGHYFRVAYVDLVKGRINERRWEADHKAFTLLLYYYYYYYY